MASRSKQDHGGAIRVFEGKARWITTSPAAKGEVATLFLSRHVPCDDCERIILRFNSALREYFHSFSYVFLGIHGEKCMPFFSAYMAIFLGIHGGAYIFIALATFFSASLSEL